MPAGDHEDLVEEELLQGLSFEAYRRTATFLTVRGNADAFAEDLHPVIEAIRAERHTTRRALAEQRNARAIRTGMAGWHIATVRNLLIRIERLEKTT